MSNSHSPSGRSPKSSRPFHPLGERQAGSVKGGLAGRVEASEAFLLDRRSNRRQRSVHDLGVNFRAIASASGIVLIALAAMMLLPLLAELLQALEFGGTFEIGWSFVFAIIITLFAGLCLAVIGRGAAQALSVRDTFVLTGVLWVLSCLFAALPFFFIQDLKVSKVALFFEAVSGLTATGATIFAEIDELPVGVLLWRSVMQWYGGIGIIVLAIAILPKLQIGGMQLFRLESSDRSEKLVPRAAELAFYITAIYLALSLACMVSYMVAGMPGFDALNHAMTTMATGGLSTRSDSIGFFDNAAIEWIAILFMILSALPFGLYIAMLRGGARSALRDPQILVFFVFVLLLSFILLVPLLKLGIMEAGDALRTALFTVVSLITTTGYAVADHSAWSPFITMVLLMTSLLGACSGSTSGGLKTWRLVVLYSSIRSSLLKLNYPRAIFPHRYGGRTVTDEVSRAAFTFFFVFIASFFLGGVVLMGMGYDFITAFSASAAAIGNVGQALGPEIGPSGHYGGFSDPALGMLAAMMILGRLEIMTLLVLFLPRFWTN